MTISWLVKRSLLYLKETTNDKQLKHTKKRTQEENLILFCNALKFLTEIDTRFNPICRHHQLKTTSKV